MENGHLPSTNADEVPIVPMTAAQKYLFDLKGWICLPALLSAEELEPILEHQWKFLKEPESLPPEERNAVGGPSQILLDHPVIVGVLNEILSYQALADENCYGFRFERTRTDRRTCDRDYFEAHGGAGYFNFCGNSHLYQMLPNKIHAGLTRVVWELNEVRSGDGTHLISGSHKTAYERADEICGRDSDLWETYACPPGSVMIFTEAICHTGVRWENQEWDRLSLFHLYNTVNCRWGAHSVPREVIATMPEKRQSLFRPVYVARGPGNRDNLKYDPEYYGV